MYQVLARFITYPMTSVNTLLSRVRSSKADCTEDKNIHFPTHNVILLPQNGRCLARRTNKTEQHCSANCQVQTLKSLSVSKPPVIKVRALSKYSKHQKIILC